MPLLTTIATPKITHTTHTEDEYQKEEIPLTTITTTTCKPHQYDRPGALYPLPVRDQALPSHAVYWGKVPAAEESENTVIESRVSGLLYLRNAFSTKTLGFR